MSEEKPVRQVGVKIVKADNFGETPTVFVESQKPIEKSDKSEQLSMVNAVNASEWITHPIDMRGLKELVDNSTILPQCIRAYKSNIAGFGISVGYREDYEEENTEMQAEWNAMERVIDLLNMDCMSKEVFENVIRDRETFGISYCEVIRDMKGNVVQLEFIIDTPSIDMTYPLEPYIETEFFYKGERMMRKKKFRKFRQNVAGRTVYFKEFGDPRIMDKRTGKYVTEEDTEPVDIDDQANEIIDFRLGSMPYGEVRWIGQVLTVDGNRRAEVLNNAYFRKGRHTPLMILVKGGTLSDDAFTKLQTYMNEIEGEKGQHSFLILETENNETGAAFQDQKQPEVEIKDLASILQKDELFQEYQENGRKKTQSAFLLPDLYVGYTTDFNRATAQTAMEVTEKQVFQPERTSLAWVINNKLLNGYGFKHVEARFDEPDITNPDDIQKILNITERAGGLTPNLAKEYTYEVLGKDGCADYALQSQIDYWNSYNENMNSLTARADEIEGLSDMLKDLSDGSEESAAMLAGMESMNDADLSAVVKQYNDLQTAQGDTATSMAELETDFSNSLTKIQTDMETAVDNLNLSDEAKANAKSTMDAYVKEIQDGVSKAQSAINSLSFANTTLKGGGYHAYAEGTVDAEPGLALVGEEGPELVNFGGGEVVYTADETANILAKDTSSDSFYVEPEQAANDTAGGDRTVTFRVEGAGEMKVTGNGVTKEDVVSLLMSNMKDALMGIIQQEIEEEGDLSYEF